MAAVKVAGWLTWTVVGPLKVVEEVPGGKQLGGPAEETRQRGVAGGWGGTSAPPVTETL